MTAQQVKWEWLGQGLALDLADTLAVERGGRLRELLDEATLPSWRARTGAPDDVALEDLRALREPVRAALYAAARDERLPDDAVEALNDASARAPTYAQLEDGRLVRRTRASARDAFLGEVAASALEVAGGEARDRLRVCGAPGCGMLYLATRPRQVWCSAVCGNRARVARHRGAA